MNECRIFKNNIFFSISIDVNLLHISNMSKMDFIQESDLCPFVPPVKEAKHEYWLFFRVFMFLPGENMACTIQQPYSLVCDDFIFFRIPELGPQIRMLIPPPSKSYSGTATAPRFKNAAITPTVRAVPWNFGREVEDSHLQLYQRYTLLQSSVLSICPLTTALK